MNLKAITTLAAALTLTVGCASKPQDVELVVDPGVVQLSKAADEISQSYRMLFYVGSARVSEAGIRKMLDYDHEHFPVQWRSEVVLHKDLYGELENLL